MLSGLRCISRHRTITTTNPSTHRCTEETVSHRIGGVELVASVAAAGTHLSALRSGESGLRRYVTLGTGGVLRRMTEG